MLFTEYNEEVHIKNEKKISYDDGFGNDMEIMSKLHNKLEEVGRLSDYGRAMKNPEYRDQLIKEFFPEEAM